MHQECAIGLRRGAWLQLEQRPAIVLCQVEMLALVALLVVGLQLADQLLEGPVGDPLVVVVRRLPMADLAMDYSMLRKEQV